MLSALRLSLFLLALHIASSPALGGPFDFLSRFLMPQQNVVTLPSVIPFSPRPLSASPEMQEKASAFWNDVLTFPDGPYPGMQLHRISGTFRLRLPNGQSIVVGYIGTTHEFGKGPNDALERASDAEIAFIHSEASRLGSIRPAKLLVEQGSSNATHSTEWTLNELLKRNRNLLASKVPEARRLTEMWMASERFTREGLPVENMCLAFNPSSLQFLREEVGLETSVLVALSRLDDYEISGRHAAQTLEVLVKENQIAGFENAQIHIRDFQRQSKNPQYAHYVRRDLTPDFLKDKYSAAYILKQTENVILLAHTGHLLGIIYYLLSYIEELELPQKEVAQLHLNRWENLSKKIRCQDLLAQQTLQSHYLTSHQLTEIAR